MTGPVLVAVVAVGIGAATSGPAGVVGGLVVAATVTAGVALGAIGWCRQIGVHLDPADARAAAPCLPGFRAVCDFVYDRRLPPPGNAPP